MAEQFQWATEKAMMVKIERGEQLQFMNQMTKEYHRELLFLLHAQFDSELIGAIGYQNMPTIATALFHNPFETAEVTQIFADEHLHAARLAGVMNGLGVDVMQWVRQNHDTLEYRLPLGRELEAGERPTGDSRVNIFYYPLEVDDLWDSWINLSIFQFLQDRGAGVQLQDAETASYRPWALAVRKIQDEERVHIAHGDKTLGKLANDPQRRDRVQELFNLWWPRVVRTFGRPVSKRNDLWRKYNLKHRTNAETFEAFLRSIHEANERPGLHKTPPIGLEIPSVEEAIAAFMQRV